VLGDFRHHTENVEVSHAVNCCLFFKSNFDFIISGNLNSRLFFFHLFSSQRKRLFVHLLVLVHHSDVLFGSLTLVVKHWRGVGFLTVGSVSEEMNKLGVELLRELDLLRLVVRCIFVHATATSWLVGGVGGGAHVHDVLDTFFSNGTFHLVDAVDELHQLSDRRLGVPDDVFETEEVDWLVGVFGDVNPVVVPIVPCLRAGLLPWAPELPNRLLRHLLLKYLVVGEGQNHIEERGGHVDGVAGADDSIVGVKRLLEGKAERVMRLFDQHLIANDSFRFEPRVLQGNIG